MPNFIRKSSIEKIASYESKNAEIDKEALFRKKEPLEQIADNIVRRIRGKGISVGLKVEKITENGDKSMLCEITFPDVYSPYSNQEGFKVTLVPKKSINLRAVSQVREEVIIKCDYNRSFYGEVKIPIHDSIPLLTLENNWSAMADILSHVVKQFREIEEETIVTYEDIVSR